MKKFLFIICMLVLTCQTTYNANKHPFFKQTNNQQIFTQRMSAQAQAEHQEQIKQQNNHPTNGNPLLANRPDLAGYINKRRRRVANQQARKVILHGTEKKLISYYKNKKQDRLEKINQLAEKMLCAYLDSTREFPNLIKKDPSIAHEVQRLFIEKVSAEQLKKMANAHTYVHYNLWK